MTMLRNNTFDVRTESEEAMKALQSHCFTFKLALECLKCVNRLMSFCATTPLCVLRASKRTVWTYYQKLKKKKNVILGTFVGETKVEKDILM